MFKEKKSSFDGKKYYEISLLGKQLLLNSFLNKDTAFTLEERKDFQLEGLIPNVVETLDEQVVRVYGQYLKKETDIERNIFLTQLYDRNETLFFRLMQEHLVEMVPMFYTPTVSDVVKQFNQNFRRPRGLFISYSQRCQIEKILNNIPDVYEIRAVCVTDSEAILGIGDQGIGGIVISVAKLAMYTLCAGFHPAKVLPIVLDVGTNNKELLQNPLYLGWRHERIRGDQYDDFIDIFVTALQKKFPNIYLHWEDFGKQTARKNLDRYKDKMCTFNDDMQGTAAVTLGALFAALQINETSMKDQRVVIYGAGTAGCSVADQIVAAMISDGLTEDEAYRRLFLIDQHGLLHSDLDHLESFQKPYAQSCDVFKNWDCSKEKGLFLEDVVKNFKPTILIGTSAQGGAFHERIVKTMASYCQRPIIFPLSNPTVCCEAEPAKLLEWTCGRALIATGSPYADVRYHGRVYPIGQCNNAFVFPGLALGIVASQATRVNNEMLISCAKVISECSQIFDQSYFCLLPSLADIQKVSYKIAFATAKAAQKSGVAPVLSDEDIHRCIHSHMWNAQYVSYISGRMTQSSLKP
jgi:malate dehydrogenase (oxaloacetate-decarboxylating)